MSNTLNELLLRVLYGKYREDYLAVRGSDDSTIWDESYKWKVLPELSSALSKYDKVTKDNATEILDIYSGCNPKKGTLIDWREMDDLRVLISKPNGYQLLQEIWTAAPENIAQVIDSNNSAMSFFGLSDKKFSPRTFGYIAAGRNPGLFPVYLWSKLSFIRDSMGVKDEWKGMTLGEKYGLYTRACLLLGEWLARDDPKNYSVDGAEISHDYRALDGQDFIYMSEHIAKRSDYVKDTVK